MLNNQVQLLHEAIAAVCPIAGVSLGAKTFDPAKVRIDFDPDATAQQRADALAVVASFDPVTAQTSLAARDAQINIDKAAFKTAYSNAVTRLNQINAAATPTNAQVIQAVRDMAQIQLQIMHVVKALI